MKSNTLRPNNWLPIFGSISVDHGKIIFHGEADTDEETKTIYPGAGVITSDLFFAGGTLSCAIEYEGLDLVPSVQFILFRNPGDQSMIRAGVEGGEPGEYASMVSYVIAAYDASKTTDRLTILSRSPIARLPFKDKYELAVSNVGSLIEIRVNNILVLRHPLTTLLPRSQFGIWFRGIGDVTVSDCRLDEARKRAFVVMQFSEPFNEIYRDLIKPVAESAGLRVERADDVAGPGFIIADIIRQIHDSEVIIADITARNPNVFYELGYAHAVNKPVILLAKKGESLPFDVSGMRVLFYEDSISGRRVFEEGLSRHLAAVLGTVT